MPKKVYVEVTTRLIVRMNDNEDIDDILCNMDYNFTSGNDGAVIEDTEIINSEVKCVKE